MQFHLPEIGAWGEEKYRLVRYYAQMFSSSMKDKWHCRVYIDLFSGAGRAKIKETGKIVDGSPLIALSIEDPFDRYIFCEEDEKNLDALRKRVMKHYSSLDTHFVCGDANKSVDDILAKIPQPSVNSNCKCTTESLREDFSRCPIAKPLSWSCIEPFCRSLKCFLRDVAEADSSRKILTQQAVTVLVGPSLPR